MPKINNTSIKNAFAENEEAFYEAWLTCDQIESIRIWNEQFESWNIFYTEQELFERLQKKIYSKMLHNV